MGNRNDLCRQEEIVGVCEKLESANGDQLPEGLTRDDIRLIQRVWNEVALDIDQDVGVDIFKLILSKSEAVRNMFGVSEFDYNNLNTSGRYISHSRLVKNALTIFIQDLDANVDTARIVSTLRSLGGRHVSFRREGFEPDFWYIFAASMVEVSKSWPIPKWHRSRFERVWQELVCFVIVNMRKGYQVELTKSNLLITPRPSWEEAR